MGVTRRAVLALSRRDALGAAALAAAGLWLAPARSARAKEAAAMPADFTPEQALAWLLEGNRRFAAGRAEAPRRTLARVHDTAPDQKPFAAILACADSRVPPEILFDQGFGDLFVVRNAGNLATPAEIASLEFGTLQLGARVLMVLGHSSCGAVKAALAGTQVPGQISALFQYLRPAVKEAGGDLAKAVAANVRLQADTLAQSSPVLAQLVQQGRLQMAGGVYDLASGVVTPLSLAG